MDSAITSCFQPVNSDGFSTETFTLQAFASSPLVTVNVISPLPLSERAVTGTVNVHAASSSVISPRTTPSPANSASALKLASRASPFMLYVMTRLSVDSGATLSVVAEGVRRIFEPFMSASAEIPNTQNSGLLDARKFTATAFFSALAFMVTSFIPCFLFPNVVSSSNTLRSVIANSSILSVS